MVNIFVYHGQDREGCTLASLIRECDTDHAFEFLPIGNNVESLKRMQRFLRAQGLDPEQTALPFIVLLTEGAERQRSVLSGPSLGSWLTQLVDAYLRTEDVTPQRIRERLLVPHFCPQVLRLLDFVAMAPQPDVPTAAPTPTPTPMAPPAPARSAGIRRTTTVTARTVPPTAAQTADMDVDADEEGDETKPLVQSTTPVPASVAGGGVRTPVNASSVMNESKHRETMVQQVKTRM
jgi:hypothetical protein